MNDGSLKYIPDDAPVGPFEPDIETIRARCIYAASTSPTAMVKTGEEFDHHWEKTLRPLFEAGYLRMTLTGAIVMQSGDSDPGDSDSADRFELPT